MVIGKVEYGGGFTSSSEYNTTVVITELASLHESTDYITYEGILDGYVYIPPTPPVPDYSAMIISIIDGMEYSFSESINTQVQVYNQTMDRPINSVNCTFEIYYPNKTKWLSGISSTVLDNRGIYYNDSYNASLPSGIYTFQANCTGGSISFYDAGNFKVSSSSMYEFMFIIILAFATMLFAYLSVNAEEWIYQYSFATLSVGFIVASFGSALAIIDNYNATGMYNDIYQLCGTIYNISIWVLFAFVIFIFIKLMMWFKEVVDGKDDYETD